MSQLSEAVTYGGCHRQPASFAVAHAADHNKLASKANYVFDVKDFGAVGDGLTDDTEAFKQAINTQMPICVPGTSEAYIVNDLPIDRNGIEIYGNGMIKSTAGSIFVITESVNRFRVSGVTLRVQGTGKACIEIGPGGVMGSGCVFNEVYFSLYNQNAHALLAVGSDWGMYDTSFRDCVYSADGASLQVPIIKLVDTAGGGICNQNTFNGGRIIGSVGATAPQIFIESQGQNYFYGNTFSNINAEIAVAGFLEARGTFGLSVRDVGMYDTGSKTQSMIVVSRGELPSRNTVLDNVWVVGAAGPNHFDIDLMLSSRSTIINCGRTPSGGSINAGDKTAILGGLWSSISGDAPLMQVGV